jgi:group II intron reverse transcriptase/maturase
VAEPQEVSIGHSTGEYREGLNDGSLSIERMELLMLREQKTERLGCSCDGTVEPYNSRGAPSIATLEPVLGDGADAVGLLEYVLDRDNLNLAYKRVKRNGGACGFDGMTVGDMLLYLKEHGDELIASIRGGWYKPMAVRRVAIPKPDGGVRSLGVPTVIDRLVQQAVAQVLQPIFEKDFSDSSYGFRPGRSAHQAIKRCKEYCEQGYLHVVDIDLAQYFDTVNHDVLMDMVSERVKDKALLRLIRRFLKSGVMADGLISPTTEGTPQGGNLSPLLSNIYLTRFDRMLESRGHKFVRYADDCNIYVKTPRAAERVMLSCTHYLETKLRLKVNLDKSQIGSPFDLKFVGFSLYSDNGEVRIRPHDKSIKRVKDKLRELTSRKQAKPMKSILQRLKVYTVGWLGYYAIADMESCVTALNKWVRRRLRQIFWKRWKCVRTKYNNLVRLGVASKKAWEWANSRLGYWRLANSWVLSTSITNRYLVGIGYDDILHRYRIMHSNYRTAVYGTVRTVV